MDERQFCIKIYQDYVRNCDAPEDLKRSLKTHERVPVFMDNMVREFRGKSFKRETIEQAVVDMTRIFIACVRFEADKRVMSDIKKMEIQADANKKSDFQQSVEDLETKGADYVLEKEGFI